MVTQPSFLGSMKQRLLLWKHSNCKFIPDHKRAFLLYLAATCIKLKLQPVIHFISICIFHSFTHIHFLVFDNSNHWWVYSHLYFIKINYFSACLSGEPTEPGLGILDADVLLERFSVFSPGLWFTVQQALCSLHKTYGCKGMIWHTKCPFTVYRSF